MAEGGSKSLQNNLCQNEEKKVVEQKSIEQKVGFPEVPVSETYSSTPHALLPNGNGLSPLTLNAMHHHSNYSETGLKNMLERAPSLSSSTPNSHEEENAEHLPRSDSAAKISNLDPVPVRRQCEATKEEPQVAEAAAEQPGVRPEEEEEEGTTFLTSYMQAGVVSTDPTSPPPSTPASSQGEGKRPTNNLSAPHMRAPPPAAPHFPYHPQMMGGAFSMGGVMPVFCCHFPMNYSPAGHPPMVNPMFPSYPYSPMTPSTGQYPPPPMMHNISLGMYGAMGGGNGGATGVNGATMTSTAAGGGGIGATGGNAGKIGVMGGGGGGSPPLTMYGGFSSQGSMDSRNIPVNNTASSAPPSSEENNCDGSRSCSINPCPGTQLTRLRDPVLQWIRKNLDRGCRKNWEALADVRGWNYQEIRDHLHDCKHSRESPFLKLLETETFFTYTVHDFLYDMERIGRRDICREFDEVLQKMQGSCT